MNRTPIMSDSTAGNVSQTFVAELCHVADLPTRQRFAAGEVVELLDAVGYSIDAAGLERLVTQGRIVPAPTRGWNALAVHQAAGTLEARRQWKPTPNKFHDAKKTAPRLAIETDGDENLRADVAKLPLGDFLLWLCEAENRQLREGFLEAALCKLKTLGVNVNE